MKKIVIIGGGRMAYMIGHFLERNGREVLGFTDLHPLQPHRSGFENRYLGTDDAIEQLSPDEVELVFGISDMAYHKKPQIFARFKALGFTFANVQLEANFIDPTVEIGEGTLVYTRSDVNMFVRIGKGCLLTHNISIGHDTEIGDFVYIGPSVTLGGSVEIGNNVLIGAGATVVPARRIGHNSVVGAGSVVTRDIPDNEVWYGVPARFVKKMPHANS